MGQFDWTPEIYLERIRSALPHYDELQEAAVAAIPSRPSGCSSWGWEPARRPAA